MHEYILAIQNLLFVICIAYTTTSTSSTKSNFTFAFNFFAALLEEIIISLIDFVAKCVHFYFGDMGHGKIPTYSRKNSDLFSEKFVGIFPW
jgi:hypothetical protein